MFSVNSFNTHGKSSIVKTLDDLQNELLNWTNYTDPKLTIQRGLNEEFLSNTKTNNTTNTPCLIMGRQKFGANLLCVIITYDTDSVMIDIDQMYTILSFDYCLCEDVIKTIMQFADSCKFKNAKIVKDHNSINTVITFTE